MVLAADINALSTVPFYECPLIDERLDAEVVLLAKRNRMVGVA